MEGHVHSSCGRWRKAEELQPEPNRSGFASCTMSRCFKPYSSNVHTVPSSSNNKPYDIAVDTSYTSPSGLGEMKFFMSNYNKDTMNMMLIMKNNQMLTDVHLEVGPEVFHAHRLVLAAASPYFKAMFTSGLREKDAQTVKLQGVCPTVMGKLLAFMYSGELIINQLLVCQLLPAATMFQIMPVVQACCTFLESQLDPSNAIGIATFAQQHGCMDLYKAANRFIEQHFIQACQEEEFLQLSACQLVTLIKRDELNVHEERDVYNAVLKWVRYDEENRRPQMERILGAVRCQYLPPSFLRDQMKNCDLLKKMPACREYLAKIFQDLSLHKPPCVKERTPSAPCVIYTAGGYLRHSLDVMECFSPEDKCWTQLAKLPQPRSGLGGAFLGGLFYAVGGRKNFPDSNADSGAVDAYNPLTNRWTSRCSMLLARNRLGVAVMDGFLYALGGSAGKTHHCTAERYDPETDTWTMIAPMAVQRMGVSVVVVNRLLYALGGFDGQLRLDSVECYHPEKDEWDFVASMRYKRSGAGVAALGQYIYVAGGHDGAAQLDVLERYGTETNTWTCLTPMRAPRSALTLAVLEGKLYAMGGYDGRNFVDIVEVYDPATNQWSEAVSLTCQRSGHATAVLCPPCLAHTDRGIEERSKSLGHCM